MLTCNVNINITFNFDIKKKKICQKLYINLLDTALTLRQVIIQC